MACCTWQGWDIPRATNCNKRPLLSKDSPLQSTWIRMMLGRPDNKQVFQPFKYGPLSKVKFFRDMIIGLGMFARVWAHAHACAPAHNNVYTQTNRGSCWAPTSKAPSLRQ